MGVSAKKQKDYAGAKLGMWLFLSSEFLLFTGPLLLYYAYRYRYGGGFAEGSGELSLALGAINTAVLLTSSLTMALGAAAVKNGRRKAGAVLLASTIALGIIFLLNKYIEWSAHLGAGVYPGGPALSAHGHGTEAFFGLYYLMTGVHGLHLLGGVVVLGVMLRMVLSGGGRAGESAAIENAGLYWHFVDIVWIYLFPLFYLIS